MTSRYDELRVAYAASSDRYYDDLLGAFTFAHKFAKEWATWLGSPTRFQPLDPDKGRAQEYVQVGTVTPNEDGETFNVDWSVRGPFDTMSRTDDGRWQFAVVTYLEKAINTYPKQAIPLVLFLNRESRALQFTHAGDEGLFDIDLLEPETWHPAFEFMLGRLVSILTASPYRSEETTRSIGFALIPERPVEP